MERRDLDIDVFSLGFQSENSSRHFDVSSEPKSKLKLEFLTLTMYSLLAISLFIVEIFSRLFECV